MISRVEGTRVVVLAACAVALMACGGPDNVSVSIDSAPPTSVSASSQQKHVSPPGPRSSVSAQRVRAFSQRTPQHHPPVSQIIVKYRDEAQAFDVATVEKRVVDLSEKTGLPLAYQRTAFSQTHVFNLPNPLPVAEAYALSKRMELEDPRIAFAQPNLIVQPLAETPGTLLWDTYLWHLKTPAQSVGGANMPPAWALATGASSIVAVVDSGVLPHPDLVPRLLPGYDFVSSTNNGDGDGRDPDASDPGNARLPDECGFGSPGRATSSWHGTHVAGTIAAARNTSSGMLGVAFNARIIPLRALGKCGGTVADLADAIAWSVGGSVPGVPANPNRAHVVNLSLGGSGLCSPLEQLAIDFARSRGAVVVAATGNESSAAISSPANCSGVVAVTAHTFQGDVADYANIGPGTTLSGPGGGSCSTPNVNGFVCSTMTSGAPTSEVWSTFNQGAISPGAYTYHGISGTSMATPHVAGVAALLMSKQPTLRPDEVKLLLSTSTRPHPPGLYCAVLGLGDCGTGLLDAKLALDRMSDRTPGIALNAPPAAVGGMPVPLSAQGSPRNGGSNAFSYEWRVISGPAINLVPNQNLASFVAPNPGGQNVIEATVVDGNGYRTSDRLTIRTNNAPSAPTRTPANDLAVRQGRALAFSLAATDPETDNIVFVANGLPAGATLSAGGQFSWPNAGPPGSYAFQVRADDGQISGAALNVVVTVTPNAAPTLTAQPSHSVAVGQSLSFQVTGADTDGDPLTYAVTGLPAGASFNSSTGAFSWPNASPAGTYQMSFSATDQLAAASVGVTVAVIAPGASPSAGGGGGGGASHPLLLFIGLLAIGALARRRTQG